MVFVKCIPNVHSSQDEEHAKWLKREGEEFYTYLSPDELIATVLEATYTGLTSDNKGKKEAFVLCSLSAGESYEDALKRETMEELRIDITSISYKEFGILIPHQHGTSAFMKVFLLQSNETPNYNPDDFIESFWLMPQELLSCLEIGDKAKSDLPIMIKHLFVK